MTQIHDIKMYFKILKFCLYIFTLDCWMLISLDIAFKSQKKKKKKECKGFLCVNFIFHLYYIH